MKERDGMEPKNIGFIGAGQMAKALAGGFVQAGILPATRLLASDAIAEATVAFCDQIIGARAAASNADLVAACDLVVLAVKPQNMPTVFTELRESDTKEKLFISIVAGMDCDRLSVGLRSDRIVRVMPNTPCLIGAGIAAIAQGVGATDADTQFVQRLLESVGQAVVLEEFHLDAVTGLSGSGPAFVYQAIEAMIAGGVQEGLDPGVARQLAVQTVIGSARMVSATDESPGDLTDRVASPNGTTVAGLRVLAEKKFKPTLTAAIAAATQRSRELRVE